MSGTMLREIQTMAARHNPPLIAARSFEAAARHKSFLKAADELHVTPAAISHQVKRLEQYLGQTLFVRLNRAVELTAAGTALAPVLRDLFTQLEDVLDPQRHQQRSTIHISVLPSLALKWLAPRVPDFEARYPQWQVRLDVNDALSDFASGQIDVGLRYGPGKYPGLQAKRWMQANVFPVCSPQLIRKTALDTPADLHRHTLIHSELVSTPGRPPGWDVWLKAAGVELADATRGPLFTNTYIALEAALAGHGVALAPAPLVARDLAEGRLVKPLSLELDNPWAFWIVHPRQQLPDARIKALTGWLMQQARQAS
jgi:LysR family glycine cleavage system transcriptional activator